MAMNSTISRTVILAIVIIALLLCVFIYTSRLNNKISAMTSTFSIPSSSHIYLSSSPTTSDDFTAEEINFFTSGVGNAEQLGKRLPQYIRHQIAQPSRKFINNYKGWGKNLDHSVKYESTDMDKLLGGKKKGFFIECGALDGIYQSTSVFFELARNWSGLLIEGNLAMRPKLLDLGRNAYVLNACLSLKPVPMFTRFTNDFALGGISDRIHNSDIIKDNDPRNTYVTCYPFNAVLAALNINTVDLFILDVEGAEIDILKTIDFNRFNILMITVEYGVWRGKGNATLDKIENVRKFFNSTGLYVEVPEPGKAFSILDVAFRRKDYLLPTTKV